MSTHPTHQTPRNQTMKMLLFNVIHPDFYDEEVTEREEDEWEGNRDVTDDVEPLGGNLFRVLAPISLTPFGPSGPRLTLGQIIEAELRIPST